MNVGGGERIYLYGVCHVLYGSYGGVFGLCHIIYGVCQVSYGASAVLYGICHALYGVNTHRRGIALELVEVYKKEGWFLSKVQKIDAAIAFCMLALDMIATAW